MEIRFTPDDGGKALAAKRPHENADHVIVDGACPACKVTPFKVAGFAGTMVTGHDTYTAPAACVACRGARGTLVAKVNTLFGIEEDINVMARCRVYG